MAINNKKYTKNIYYNNKYCKKYYNIVNNIVNHSNIVNFYINNLIKLQNIIINDINNNKKTNINIFINFIICLQLSNPKPSENKNIISIMFKYLNSLDKDEFNNFKLLYSNILNSKIYVLLQKYFKSYIEGNKKNKNNIIIKKKNLIKNNKIVKN